MEKILKFFSVFLFIMLCMGIFSIAEEITLTTYYPAPYGAYQKLMVGANYATTEAPTNGMIVEGNVGIGTTSPTAKLDVNGTVKTTALSISDAANSVSVGATLKGYTGDLNDSKDNKIADVVNGIITAVYY